MERSNLNGFTLDSRNCHVTLRFTRCGQLFSKVRSEGNGVERSNLNGFTVDSRDCHVTLRSTRCGQLFSKVRSEGNRVERSNLILGARAKLQTNLLPNTIT
ncbi:MAG: hypothetical protein QNJ74_05870 [Trichodesmium sp. MO_231.B1]|nr:hypothetical protein [Trichodesmium sp. MO_231.B1]